MKKPKKILIFVSTALIASLFSSASSMNLSENEKKEKIIKILKETNNAFKLIKKNEAQEYKKKVLRNYNIGNQLTYLTREANNKITEWKRFINTERRDILTTKFDPLYKQLESFYRNPNQNLEERRKYLPQLNADGSPPIEHMELDEQAKLRKEVEEIKKIEQKTLKAENALLAFFRQKLYTFDMVNRILMKAEYDVNQLNHAESDSEENIVKYAVFLEKKQQKLIKKPVVDSLPMEIVLPTGYKNYFISFNIILYSIAKAVNQGVQVIPITSALFLDLMDFFVADKNKMKEFERDPVSNQGQLKYVACIVKEKIMGSLKINIYIPRMHENNELEKEEWVILVVKNSEDEQVELKKVGLDPDHLKPFYGTYLDKLAQQSNPDNYAIYMDYIQYHPRNEEEWKSLPKKIVYTIGHGNADPNLMLINQKLKDSLKAGTCIQMRDTAYERFLDSLIKCALIVNSSCFSGSWNSIKMHKKIFDYPVVVSSISDNASSNYTYIDFKTFYENISKLIVAKVPYSRWRTHEKFKAALKSLFGPNLKNNPSICCPGEIYYQMVDLGQTKTIKNKEKEPVKANGAKAMVFEENISDACIIDYIPMFISRIPGPAHHIVREVKTFMPFDEFIKNMSGKKERINIVSPKMFFIGDALFKNCDEFKNISTCKNLNIENFYFMTYQDKITQRIMVIGGGLLKYSSYYVYNKDIWFTFSYDRFKKELKAETIGGTKAALQYLKGLAMALENTTPTKEALYVTQHSDDNNLLVSQFSNEDYYDADKEFCHVLNNYLGRFADIGVDLIKHEKFMCYDSEIEKIPFLEKIKLNIVSIPAVRWAINYWNWNPDIGLLKPGQNTKKDKTIKEEEEECEGEN